MEERVQTIKVLLNSSDLPSDKKCYLLKIEGNINFKKRTIYEVRKLLEFPIHKYNMNLKEKKKDLGLELKLKC